MTACSSCEGVSPERTLIVYCHPYQGSFCHAVLEALTGKLDAAGTPYDVIDLHADEFDPTYSTEELSLFSRGGTVDPLVERYQRMLKGAGRLVLIAPVWWNGLPAQLKGWFDKVMKPGFAYTQKDGWTGLLTNIQEETVYTTSGNDTEALETQGGDAIRRALIGGTFVQLGFGPARWVNFGGLDGATPEQLRAYLAQVA